MKKTILLLALLSAVNAITFSQDNPLIKYLPPNASMIMSFNPIQIAKKVPGETFRQSAMYREMMKKESPGLKAFLTDPSVIGIDFSNNLFLIISSDSDDEESTPTIHIIGLLKDEKAFAKNFNKLNDNNSGIETFGNNKILMAGNSMAIAWNNEAFVLTSGNKDKMRKALRSIDYSDSSATKDFQERMDKMMAEEKIMERNYCFEILTPKPDNSFFKNAAFAEVMKENADIRTWSNGKGMGGSLSKMPPMLANIFSSLKKTMGSERISVTNFENGKIAGHTKTFISPQMAEVYKKYPAGKLNTKLIERLPEGNLMMLMAGSANPEMGKEMLKQSGLGSIMDSIKAKIPFDISQFSSTFGGDVLFAVFNNSSAETIDAAGNYKPGKQGMFGGMDLIVAAPIINKERFEKLRKSVGNFIDSMRKTESGEKMFAGKLPVVKYNDSLFVLTMTEETAEAFLNNKATGKVPEWVSSNSTHPFLINMNFKSFMSLIYSSVSRQGNSGDQSFMKAISVFDQLIITSGDYANGSLNSSMEFRFANPNENAMKQLFDFMNIAIEESMKEKKVIDEEVEMPPPPAEELKQYTPPVIKKDEEVQKPPPPPPVKKPVKKTKG